MSNPDTLRRLVQLLTGAEAAGLNIVLAGGLGVVLRVEWARVQSESTLGRPPVARSTPDIDALVVQDVIVDPDRMRELGELLKSLGYSPVAGAEYYQWVGDDGIRVDLQAETPADRRQMKIDSRRLRPHGYRELHAHRLDEAIGCELHTVSIPLTVAGLVAGTVDTCAVVVQTPNIFSYWSMKLLALRDTLESDDQDFGRRHAYDMFALWASSTKSMWTDAERVVTATAAAAIRHDLREAATELFQPADGLGKIRVKEALKAAGEERAAEEVDAMAADVVALFTGELEGGSR